MTDDYDTGGLFVHLFLFFDNRIKQIDKHSHFIIIFDFIYFLITHFFPLFSAVWRLSFSLRGKYS